MSTLSSPPSTTAPDDHLDRADRDERRGGAFELPPVEHRADGEERDPEDERDRGRRAGGVAGVGQRRVVGRGRSRCCELPLEISLWNGMRLSLSLAASKVSQLAKKSSVPARKMARPRVHPRR